MPSTLPNNPDPIVSIKLGGCPPPRRGSRWIKLLDQILHMPDDGTWLRVEMHIPADTRSAQSAIDTWHKHNPHYLDCQIQTRIVPPNVLWVRKVYNKNAKENAND